MSRSDLIRWSMRAVPGPWRWAVNHSALKVPPGWLSRHWIVASEAYRLFPDGVLCTVGDVTLRVPFGMRPYYLSDTEQSERALVAKYLRTGDVAVDVGANAGYYTLLAARVASRVHAIEPSPRNLPILRRNVSGLPNVTIYPFAASDRAGETEFTLSADGGNDSLRDELPYGKTSGRARVRTQRIDAEIDGPVQFVKMDVQGAEPLALGGMARVLAQSPDVTLLVEWAPLCLATFGYAAEDLITQLRAVGLDRVEAVIDGALAPLDSARELFAADPQAYCNLIATR